jgi:AcrR family transcriptional regulator
MTEIELSRRERKKDETRQRIFKAAIKLFHTRGFDATTVDDITEKADVGKGTFFNYFPRKESVLTYLSLKRLQENEANASQILAAARPAREKLIEIYCHAASAYEEDRELSRYVVNELMGRAFSPSEEEGHGQRWQRLIIPILEKAQASGEFRKDVPPARAEAVLTGVYYALVYCWVNCLELDFDLQAEMRAQLGLVFDGIGARKAVR